MDLPGSVQTGSVVGGRYRIERVLGAGGMGVVVAATHLALNQTVALKLLRRERLGTARDVARFVREARLASRIRSPHVARILDAGTFKAGGTVVPFIALEYLEGLDLARLLARRGRLPAPFVAAVAAQACAALTEAHALGMVHRDVKPANLFLGRREGRLEVKVLDFGVALWRSEPDGALTTTDAVIGSPAYMAPEQMRLARIVDGRSDVWSLGVILFEAVAGRLPFHGPSYADLCLKVMLDAVPPLPEDVATPPGFDEVVRRCLAKEPEGRFAGAAELGAALAPSAAELAPEVVTELLEAGLEGPGGAAAVGTNTRRELDGIAASRLPSRRWSLWAASGIGLAILFIAASVNFLRETPAPAPPATPAPPTPRIVAVPLPVAVPSPDAAEVEAPPIAVPAPNVRRRARPARPPTPESPPYDPLEAPF